MGIIIILFMIFPLHTFMNIQFYRNSELTYLAKMLGITCDGPHEACHGGGSVEILLQKYYQLEMLQKQESSNRNTN